VAAPSDRRRYRLLDLGVQLLELYFLVGIDRVCEILSVAPLQLLVTVPFNPKNTPPWGGFNCS